MDRHRHDDGFTLIEMIIVLMLLCFGIALFPLTQVKHHTLPMRMEQLKQQLLIKQELAMRQGTTIEILFSGTSMVVDHHQIKLHMSCQGSLRFHENGNVDRARTITCSTDSETGELVVQLGSGRMYVK